MRSDSGSATVDKATSTSESGNLAYWVVGGAIVAVSATAYLAYRRRSTLSRASGTVRRDACEAQAAAASPASPQHATNGLTVLMPALDVKLPPTPFEAALRGHTPFAAAPALIPTPESSQDSQETPGTTPGHSYDMFMAGAARNRGAMGVSRSHPNLAGGALGASRSHADLARAGAHSMGSRPPDPARASAHSMRSTRTHSSDLDCAVSIPKILKSRASGFAALELGALLGRGSFGKVYKGRWKGAMVAIKVIEHNADDNSKMDGLRESLLCSSIQHPNVLITYRVIRKNAEGSQMEGPIGSLDSAQGSAGHAPQVPGLPPSPTSPSVEDVHETWLISEYCDKGNLDRAVLAGRFHEAVTKKPNLLAIYRCLLDIAAGMDYLHSLGVLHGDLKGGNVLLKSTSVHDDPRGFLCKIGDFGLSRVLDADNAHVTTNTYGTVSYCAPEVLKEGKLTRAADMYSFSMMMWEIWTGEGLFRGMNSTQVFFKVMNGYRPPVPEGMPEGFRDLMIACWHEDPDQRPPFEDVERFLRAMYYAAASGDGDRPRNSRRSLELNPWG